jgi:hypothetical protein
MAGQSALSGKAFEAIAENMTQLVELHLPLDGGRHAPAQSLTDARLSQLIRHLTQLKVLGVPRTLDEMIPFFFMRGDDGVANIVRMKNLVRLELVGPQYGLKRIPSSIEQDLPELERVVTSLSKPDAASILKNPAEAQSIRALVEKFRTKYPFQVLRKFSS